MNKPCMWAALSLKGQSGLPQSGCTTPDIRVSVWWDPCIIGCYILVPGTLLQVSDEVHAGLSIIGLPLLADGSEGAPVPVDGDCVDLDEDCGKWAEAGFCKTKENRVYMVSICPLFVLHC